jgi:hypothetical protein
MWGVSLTGKTKSNYEPGQVKAKAKLEEKKVDTSLKDEDW